GVNEYDELPKFKDMVTGHLRELIERRLESFAVTDSGRPLPSMPTWSSERSPFPGLRPFTAEYEAVFFGREREILRLLAEMAVPDRRLLAVVGASGSGKSSLVSAGLIPRLRGGALAGSAGWSYASTFRPRVDPFMSLAVALTPLLQ